MGSEAWKDKQRRHYSWCGIGAHRGLAAEYAPIISYQDEVLGDICGKLVLDLGSGTGANLPLLAERGALAVSFDLSRQALGDQDNLLRVCGDAEEMPFRDGCFDVVYGRAVLHHLPELGSALAQAGRVLKPAGLGFFVEPMAHNPLVNLGRWWRNRFDYRLRDQHPFRRGELESLLSGVFGDVKAKPFFLFLILFQAANVFFKRVLGLNWSLTGLYLILYPLDDFLVRLLPRFAQTIVCSVKKK